jgi:malate dehydrogenase
VTGHKGADQLAEALTGADIVVIPAGVPRKPGMTRDDLFNTNASIVATLSDACAKCVCRAASAVAVLALLWHRGRCAQRRTSR